MFVAEIANPTVGEEPSDVVRSLVFMSNLAAQEITGVVDASHSAEQLVAELAAAPPDFSNTILALVSSGSGAELPLGAYGYPLLPATGDSTAYEVDAWLSVSAPLLENTAQIDVEIVLDAEFQPIPGHEMTEDACQVLASAIAEAKRFCHKLGRSQVIVWQQYPVSTLPVEPYASRFEADGLHPAFDELMFCLVPPLELESDAEVGIHTFTGQDFPSELLADVAALYSKASEELPHGELQLVPEQWDSERLAHSTSHFRTLGITNYHALALTDSGQVIGISEAWSQPSGDRAVVNLGLTYVLPEFRHQGIGHALFSSVWDCLLQDMGQRLRCYVAIAKENTEGIQFAEKFGATPISRMVAYRTR